MAAKTSKDKIETLITYIVVKAHDGLAKGTEIRRKAGHPGAEHCVRLGLWKVKDDKKK